MQVPGPLLENTRSQSLSPAVFPEGEALSGLNRVVPGSDLPKIFSGFKYIQTKASRLFWFSRKWD